MVNQHHVFEKNVRLNLDSILYRINSKLRARRRVYGHVIMTTLCSGAPDGCETILKMSARIGPSGSSSFFAGDTGAPNVLQDTRSVNSVKVIVVNCVLTRCIILLIFLTM